VAKFDVNNVSVESLLGYVSDGTIAIPEIQRSFCQGLRLVVVV